MPVTQLVPTRFNPRRNFGTEEELREFGLKLKKKQLQPAVAVTRDAYLQLWPGEAEKIGGAVYVIANGERRWRGSQAAGVLTLDVVVDDEIAKSRADFLDAVLSENNDREDLDPIERALGIRTMVEELDGKAKVAEHYGKSAGWVTRQMYLLDLAPELQELVSSGELPLRETRALAKLPVHEQVEAWRARSAEREKEKAQPRQPRSQQKQSSDGEAPGAAAKPAFTAVKKSATDGADEASEAVGFTAVKPTGAGEPSPAQPDASVPHQASAEDAAAADPLADFAVYVSKAGAFADSVQGLAQAYAKAKETDQGRTAELAAQLRAHVLRVVDQLPDVCPAEDATA